MSWSLSYAAQGKAKAKQIAAEAANLPVAVKMVIGTAIDAIYGYDDAIILVEGHGHQADGMTANNVTTVTLSVKPLTLSN